MTRAASVFVCLIVGALACGAQQVDVSGRVRIVSRERSSASRADNVVVWLTPLGRAAIPQPAANHPLVLSQHNKSFEPHLLVVPVGAVVQFPNRDPFFHNVFSMFEGKKFDLGLYEAGTTRNVSFDRPGVSYIFCNIHAEMSAVVIALDTPYYGISNAKGQVRIPNVLVGRYWMRTWAEQALPEALNAAAREVNVTEDSPLLGVVEITTESAHSAHKNKFGMDYEPPTPEAPGYQQP